MAPVTDAPAHVLSTTGSVALASDAGADLAAKMDHWGALQRVSVATIGLAISLALVPRPDLLLWVGGAYLALGGMLPRLLEGIASPTRRACVRWTMLLIDVTVTSLFAYRWGPRSLPAAVLYVPIVSGWTLAPQRLLGRVASYAILLAYGTLLLAEQLGWLPPHTGLLARSEPAVSALVSFATLTCAVAATHGVMEFMRQRGRTLSRLAADLISRGREAQRARQHDETERLEALGRLAGGVAHDMNNLLTVLIGCAEIAEANLTSNTRAAHAALGDLQRAAERCASLTAQLLDFASRRPCHPENVELGDALRRTRARVEALLAPSIALELAPAHERCVAHLDPGGLERLVLQLAANARDAMPDGGTLRLATYVRPTSDGDEVVLEVSDTGRGIGETELPHIFEPFFTTKARDKGTGLGLASVYGIVKQSHGHIEVSSPPALGTTFRIAWPRQRASVPAPVHVVEASDGGDALILLVDDEPDVRAVTSRQLEAAGYRVLSAASGEEALPLIARHGDAIALLVSDVRMPGMSGMELARAARSERPALPILLITGYCDELDGAPVDAVALLAKPFTGRRLLTEVQRALGGSGRARPRPGG